MPWVAFERDPSHRVIDNRLKALATKGSSQAVDCRTAGRDAAECVLGAFSTHRPFYWGYDWQGADFFGYRGLAGDELGNVYDVNYNSIGWMVPAPPKGQLLDDNHTFVMPCPEPVALQKNTDGSVTCVMPRGE